MISNIIQPQRVNITRRYCGDIYWRCVCCGSDGHYKPSKCIPDGTTHVKYICASCILLNSTDILISPKIYAYECFDKLGNLIKQFEF